MSVQIVFDHFPAMIAKLPPECGTVVQATCKRIQGRARISMTGPKHGKTYRKGRSGATKSFIYHRASAPGEPPARDTGALANSIRVRMTGHTEGMVYSNADYSAALEFGMAKIAARPYMGPAGDAERSRHTSEIERVVKGL